MKSKSAPVLIFSEDSAAVTPLQSGITDSLSDRAMPPAVQDTVLPPCDIIFFKSGKLEYCKIIENSPTTISYKMCDYSEGATIVVNKSTVHKIRYANGKEEIITAEQNNVNAYVQKRKDRLSTLALIFSLCGLVLGIFAVAGLVLGIISLAKISRRKDELRGKGTAIWAICISAVILIILFASV
ncbi:MAG: DUF4190 domain-containing protein [Cytophaga sp.]|uniref:DUF4190 domain-containing protein n=1 Tax=Cytophaga sp. TaxID=29535 RepID=UPI003F801BE2